MVSAWATENKLSLGQVVVDEKSNEITAIPELLRLLDDLRGAGDDRRDGLPEGDRRRRSATARGDYVLAVKQNQPTLYEQVEAAIDEALERGCRGLSTSTRPSRRGTAARRRGPTRSSPAPESVDPEGQWRDLSAVGMAISERIDARGRASLEARYYILSRLLIGRGVRRGGAGPLGDREQPALAVGCELPRGRMPGSPGSCAGEPERDPAVRPGAAQARDQLPDAGSRPSG